MDDVRFEWHNSELPNSNAAVIRTRALFFLSVKYERRHSMRHTDWYHEADRWRDKWLIAYMDDALRFIAGYGISDEATTENAISVLDDSINRYGKPLELLTDYGSQFCDSIRRLAR
jgi:transposase InsO family protein